MRWHRQNQFVIYRGFRYSGVRYSRVCFHIFCCNSAGLSNVVRYNGVFVIAGCHCKMFGWFSLVGFSLLPTSSVIAASWSKHPLYHQSWLFSWKSLIGHGNPSWRKKHFNCIVCSNLNINVELSAVGVNQPIAKNHSNAAMFLCVTVAWGRTAFFRGVNMLLGKKTSKLNFCISFRLHWATKL